MDPIRLQKRLDDIVNLVGTMTRIMTEKPVDYPHSNYVLHYVYQPRLEFKPQRPHLESHNRLPTFDGSLDPYYFREWVRQLEDYFESRHIPESHQVSIAKSHLKGQTLQFWMRLKDHKESRGEYSTWKDMRRDLNLKYRPSTNDCHLEPHPTPFVGTNRGHYCGRDHPSFSNIRVAPPPCRSSLSLDDRPFSRSSVGSSPYDSPFGLTSSQLSQPLAFPVLDPPNFFEDETELSDLDSMQDLNSELGKGTSEVKNSRILLPETKNSSENLRRTWKNHGLILGEGGWRWDRIGKGNLEGCWGRFYGLGGEEGVVRAREQEVMVDQDCRRIFSLWMPGASHWQAGSRPWELGEPPVVGSARRGRRWSYGGRWGIESVVRLRLGWEEEDKCRGKGKSRATNLKLQTSYVDNSFSDYPFWLKVIGKLSEGRATHIPYRDSKLTRLLQSSLSGHGLVSLICTVTPASSNMEETHNTLKFASRAKRVEIYASRNRIIDEKSLIKKYQREISSLKQELEQLKRGMLTGVGQEEIMSLKQKVHFVCKAVTSEQDLLCFIV
ncbi:Kinesin-like protein NACK1 [Dendrobium catenatum]|uniref:Kinesin-like protein NACK1 n=1 Tax=Dendrobium catenatum TaxID=906689 RepID=A0A2I0VXS9_9ASPA|nr:Kinesin-like protein NACK1 [Dendrobium catenatum]